MKRALICGISGQDGAYLARLLAGKDYAIVGTSRNASGNAFANLAELGVRDRVETATLDPCDFDAVTRALELARPDEVYNLGGPSSVAYSFEHPADAFKGITLAALHFLEAIRVSRRPVRYCNVASSECFGALCGQPATEDTPFRPRSPYAAGKAAAHLAVESYRANYGVWACSGILFNHESPLRGREFVTRKISEGLARIRAGTQDVLELGNLDSRRDWGFAGDYVAGLWAMMQANRPETYIFSTHRVATVRDFVTMTAQVAGFDLEWMGNGEAETGIDRQSRRTLVRVNPRFYRPSEVDVPTGDASRARRDLGWEPRTTLEQLCRMMAEADIRRSEAGGRASLRSGSGPS